MPWVMVRCILAMSTSSSLSTWPFAARLQELGWASGSSIWFLAIEGSVTFATLRVGCLAALLNAEAGAEVFAELLDIDLSQLTGDEPPRRIPAGKHALKCLETIDPIQAKDLARLGGEGTECSICRSFF